MIVRITETPHEHHLWTLLVSLECVVQVTTIPWDIHDNNNNSNKNDNHMEQASHERRLPGGEFRDKECPENTLPEAIKGSCVQTAESTNTTTRNPRKEGEGVQGEEDVT